MDPRKVIVSGFVAGLVSFIAGLFLYLNPLVTAYYEDYGDWPGAKPMEFFGGMDNWLFLTGGGTVLLMIFTAMLYSYIDKAVKMKSVVKKGAFFGSLLWLSYTLPAVYHIWLMYTYPGILLLLELVLSFIGNVITGIVLAWLYERL